MADLLNMTTVADLQSFADEDDPDFFRDTVQAFEQNAKELLEKLNSSADTSEIKRLLHQLKGSSYNVGAQLLGDVSEKYEQQVMLDSVNVPVREMLSELQAAFQRTIAAFQQLDD